MYFCVYFEQGKIKYIDMLQKERERKSTFWKRGMNINCHPFRMSKFIEYWSIFLFLLWRCHVYTMKPFCVYRRQMYNIFPLIAFIIKFLFVHDVIIIYYIVDEFFGFSSFSLKCGTYKLQILSAQLLRWRRRRRR